MNHSLRTGFSLVELSIVLVILGLLVGGILAGQSLIRASELRAVTTEYNRWITATHAFRDKYFGLPGDLRNATSFWGDNNTACPDAAIANGTPGACNGNGNNLVEDLGTAAGAANELFAYWQQLALAGLIEGNYTGLNGVTSLDAVLTGTSANSPISKMGNNATWQIRDLGVRTATAGIFHGTYGNSFIYGIAAGGMPAGSLMRGEEAWNIDTKTDDGKAATGKMVAYISYNCATAANGSALANDVSSSGTMDAIYNLTSSSKLCAPLFRQAF